MKRFLLYIAVFFAFVGCNNPEEFNTQIVFRPYQQVSDGAEYTPLEGVVGYAFAVDTAEVDIVSYDELLEGRVTMRATGEVVEAFSKTTPYITSQAGFEGAVAMPVEREFAMLVALDTQNKDYAYTYYEVGLNLPQTFISLTFRTWYGGTRKQGKWIFEIQGIEEEEEGELPEISQLN